MDDVDDSSTRAQFGTPYHSSFSTTDTRRQSVSPPGADSLDPNDGHQTCQTRYPHGGEPPEGSLRDMPDCGQHIADHAEESGRPRSRTGAQHEANSYVQQPVYYNNQPPYGSTQGSSDENQIYGQAELATQQQQYGPFDRNQVYGSADPLQQSFHDYSQGIHEADRRGSTQLELPRQSRLRRRAHRPARTSTSGSIAPESLQRFAGGTPPWSSASAPTDAEKHKRRLSDLHGMESYRLDRHYPDKMEDELDALRQKEAEDNLSGNDMRKRKKPKTGKRSASSRSGGRGKDKERESRGTGDRDSRGDRNNGASYSGRGRRYQ